MTDNNQNTETNTNSKKKGLRGWRLWGLILLVCYSLFGFLGLPYIIKSQMISQTPKFTDRVLSVSAVKFNPFTLSLTLEGISLADKDNVELVGFDRFHVNFDTFSLFRWAWTFSEISFAKPRFNLRIGEKGELSFADLLKSDETAVEEAPPTTDEKAELPRIIIKQFMINGGIFAFEDQSLATPYQQKVEPLNLNLTDFSTLPEREGPYGIYVEIPGGGKIRWQGDVAINPISSEGDITLSDLPLETGWRYAQDQLKFSLDSGFFSSALHYKFSMSDLGPQLNASNIRLALNKLEIRDKKHEHNDIELPSITLTGGNFDLQQQTVHFNEFAIVDGKIDTFMQEDGVAHLAELFIPIKQDSDSAAEEPVENEESPTETDTAESKPWSVKLDKAMIDGLDVRYVDRTTKPNAEILIDDIKIAVTDITNKPDDQFGLQASLILNKTGNLNISGKVAAMEPMANLDLDFQTISIPAFQPYLNQTTNVGLASGNTSLKGHLDYKASEENPDIALTARFDISDLAIENLQAKNKVTAWKSLVIDGIDLKLMPNQLEIKSIILDQLDSNIDVAKDGSMNVATLVKSDGTEPPKKEEPEKPAEPFPIAIGEILLKNANVGFNDNSVSPRFTSRINTLNGSVKGLSSENNTRADVDISGKVDDYASLGISGQVNPLSENLYTDLKFAFSDYDMVSLTPYTGTFIGKTVDKGRMSFDVKYNIDESNLKGDNNLLLDQFTLGEKVESEKAVNLPVSLAIALLKDTKGKIDFDVPVEGNLDDPEFKLSGAIFTALGNVITNIATSPFKALGKLAGGGDDMDRVSFSPGNNMLLPEHTKTLDTLGNALKKRPQLLLEVRGQFDKQHDKFVIQENKLRTLLSKTKEAPPKGKSLDTLEVSLLEKHYSASAGDEAISKLKINNSEIKEGAPENSPKILNEPKYKAELLKSLITSQEVNDTELRDLARSRGDTVRNYFVNNIGLPAKRIFVLEAAEDKEGSKESVNTIFTLTAK